ncbi:ClbS/DfsB family four-helix bundle protein [uncultured Roseobacter sp.]|uniref:ClbS/DfsB family four-helix bundle protein n=1 Tax=uncultured Roseobacter sp. TaxID=114847 RepID=UPI0026379DEB|nr:ClbS/DfsB family four-helix bundle protein [uncultured Roseobacter sp.]
MAAANKSELIDILQKEYAKLDRLITPILAEQAMLKDEAETSIKDVVAHRAHWIRLFLGWYADGQAGKTVHFPAEGYKWNELKRYNADLRAAQKDVDWAAAQALLKQEYAALLAFVQTCSNEHLYGGPMQGAKNHWTPGRWAEAAGPSHFRSAAKYIRARVRSL